MKKQKKIVNATIEYTVPFTVEQVADTLAKKAGCKSPTVATVELGRDGSAIVRYTVVKG